MAETTQIDVNQTLNATIVSSGTLLIALQAAMRWAIIENSKTPNGDLQTLVARIKAEVEKAPAEGFSPQDVSAGKAQVVKFIDVITDAINREVAAR